MAKKSKKAIEKAMAIDVPYTPSISITEEQLPEIKDWSVGEEYSVKMKLEMTGLNKDEWQDSVNFQANFKIKSAEDAS